MVPLSFQASFHLQNSQVSLVRPAYCSGMEIIEVLITTILNKPAHNYSCLINFELRHQRSQKNLPTPNYMVNKFLTKYTSP
jgi:hypothetical protein